jgi:membrane-associated phospholipid phosphatase
MTKGIIVLLLPVFMFLSGYSQSDSVLVDSRDTIHKINTNEPPPTNAEEKKSSPVKEGRIYTLKPGVDIPIVAVGTAWSLYAFTKIYVKTPPTVEEIEGLKKSNINAFDRWAVYPYSESIDKNSYYPFYASIPLPLIFFLTGKETRNDFFKLAFLYWEAMAVTGLLGTNATYHVDRYRPYAYSPETPMDKKTSSITKNSFYAGHVQIVATPTFFIAKVFADYHPDSKIKWVFYGGASVATGVTAYMRLKAGEHFPTDILLGTVTGALAGILVPQFHKTRSAKDHAMNVLPYSTGDINGLVFTYQLTR